MRMSHTVCEMGPGACCSCCGAACRICSVTPESAVSADAVCASLLSSLALDMSAGTKQRKREHTGGSGRRGRGVRKGGEGSDCSSSSPEQQLRSGGWQQYAVCSA